MSAGLGVGYPEHVCKVLAVGVEVIIDCELSLEHPKRVGDGMPGALAHDPGNGFAAARHKDLVALFHLAQYAREVGLRFMDAYTMNI